MHVAGALEESLTVVVTLAEFLTVAGSLGEFLTAVVGSK